MMSCKVYKHAMNIDEKIKRAYNAKIRKIIRWCEENEHILLNYDDANMDDICILSKSEYDLHECKRNIAEDNESYFLTQDSYEEYIESNE